MNKKGKNKLFKDPMFDADETMIFDERITEKLDEGTLIAMRARRRERNQHNWRNVRFVRPKDYYGKETNFTLFHTVEPTDITQGTLGDCYYMAALSSLAEEQNRIVDLFRARKKNRYGCYAVQMCINGEE